MIFETSNVRETPAKQYERALQLTFQLRALAVIYRDQALAGSLRVMDLETGLLFVLVETRIELELARNIPGIVAYAKQQRDNPVYDIAAAFTNVIGELDTTLGWMETNFPKDAAGHLISKTFVGDGSGKVQSDIITAPAQLTSLAARLDALIATMR